MADRRIGDGRQRDLGDYTLDAAVIGRVDGDLHLGAVFLTKLNGANLPNFTGVVGLCIPSSHGPGDGGLGELLGLPLSLL